MFMLSYTSSVILNGWVLVLYLPLFLLGVLDSGLHPVDFRTSFKSVKIILDFSALSVKKTMPISFIPYLPSSYPTPPRSPQKKGREGRVEKYTSQSTTQTSNESIEPDQGEYLAEQLMHLPTS